MVSLDCNMMGESSALSSHIVILGTAAKIQLPVQKILLLGAPTLKCWRPGRPWTESARCQYTVTGWDIEVCVATSILSVAHCNCQSSTVADMHS